MVESLAHAGAGPTEDAFSTVLPAAIFADAFPFILWALVAHDVLRGVLGQAGLPLPPDSGAS